MVMRGVPVLFSLLILAACTLGGTGGPKPAAENPITGGTVAVSALAPPPGAAAPAPVAPTPTAVPAPGGAAPEAAGGSVKVDIPPASPPASPEEAACRKKGGTWATVGKAGRACVEYTKDAGKSCTRGTQCEGLCLARSGTCAPITPLFGCNDILQDDGTRATLCID